MELAIGAVGPTVVAVLFSNPIHQWKLVHKMINALEAIDRLKQELDALRPLPPDTLAQVEQKLRLEFKLQLERHRRKHAHPSGNSQPHPPRTHS